MPEDKLNFFHEEQAFEEPEHIKNILDILISPIQESSKASKKHCFQRKLDFGFESKTNIVKSISKRIKLSQDVNNRKLIKEKNSDSLGFIGTLKNFTIENTTHDETTNKNCTDNNKGILLYSSMKVPDKAVFENTCEGKLYQNLTILDSDMYEKENQYSAKFNLTKKNNCVEISKMHDNFNDSLINYFVPFSELHPFKMKSVDHERNYDENRIKTPNLYSDSESLEEACSKNIRDVGDNKLGNKRMDSGTKNENIFNTKKTEISEFCHQQLKKLGTKILSTKMIDCNRDVINNKCTYTEVSSIYKPENTNLKKIVKKQKRTEKVVVPVEYKNTDDLSEKDFFVDEETENISAIVKHKNTENPSEIDFFTDEETDQVSATMGCKITDNLTEKNFCVDEKTRNVLSNMEYNSSNNLLEKDFFVDEEDTNEIQFYELMSDESDDVVENENADFRILKKNTCKDNINKYILISQQFNSMDSSDFKCNKEENYLNVTSNTELDKGFLKEEYNRATETDNIKNVLNLNNDNQFFACSLENKFNGGHFLFTLEFNKSNNTVIKSLVNKQNEFEGFYPDINNIEKKTMNKYLKLIRKQTKDPGKHCLTCTKNIITNNINKHKSNNFEGFCANELVEENNLLCHYLRTVNYFLKTNNSITDKLILNSSLEKEDNDFNISHAVSQWTLQYFEKCDEVDFTLCQINSSTTSKLSSITSQRKLFTSNFEEKTKKNLECQNVISKTIFSPQKEESSNELKTCHGELVVLSDNNLKMAYELFGECSKDDLASQDVASRKTISSQTEESFNDFKTCNGKLVTVSDNALKKAHTLFKEETKEDLECQDAISTKTFRPQIEKTSNEFRTCHGKFVAVSNNALKKAHRLFEKEIKEDLECQNVTSTKPFNRKLEDSFNEFKTCTEKSGAESDDALKMAAVLFGESTKEDLEYKDVTSKTFSQQIEESFNEFRTCNGKSVAVSNNALQMANKLFGEWSIVNNNLASQDVVSRKAISPQKEESLDEFKTCSGKLVAVTDKALKMAHRLFEVTKEDLECQNVTSTKTDRPQKEESSNEFKTCNGKLVAASNNALKLAQKLFGEVINEDLECENVTSTKPFNRKLEDSFNEFKTCTEKSGAESDDALKMAAVLFGESTKEDLEYKDVTSKTFSQQIEESFNEFRTCNGKSVAVSNNALQMANKLFGEWSIVNNNLASQDVVSRKAISPQKEESLDEFKTCSGKLVAVTDKALKMAHRLFEVTKEDLEWQNVTSTKTDRPQKEESSNEFKTCNGKLVAASNNALKLAQKLFGEVINEDLECENVTSRKTVSPQINKFKPYNEKLVSVSDYAVKMDNSLFNDMKLTESNSHISRNCINTPKIERCRQHNLLHNNWTNDELSSSTLQKSIEFENSVESALAFEIAESTSAFMEDEINTSETLQISEKLNKESPIANFNSNVKLTSTPNLTKITRKRLSNTNLSPVVKRQKFNALLDDTKIDRDQINKFRIQMSENQLTLIKSKWGNEKPIKGKLILLKQTNSCKIKLWCIFNKKLMNVDDDLSRINKNILGINSVNAAFYRFNASDFYGGDIYMSTKSGIKLLDNGILILNTDDTAGLLEIQRCFLCLPGVDPSLISSNWISNHYRWIVWKLATYEKSFPAIFANKALTLENVLLQLKYRYDREIDLSQRSCFKKILELDESVSRRFICCVSSVRKVNTAENLESKYELELTDGWYSIWSIVDDEMEKFIKNGKVGIGTKLIVQGAELINFSNACDPLNIGNEIRLKINSNSVRRAIWYSKMGFTKNPNPLPASLKSVLPFGGTIGSITAEIVRVYPLIFISKENGRTIYRNINAERVHVDKLHSDRSEKADKMYQEVLAEAESQLSKKIKPLTEHSTINIEAISDPEILCNILEEAEDSSIVEDLMISNQLELVKKFQIEKRNKIIIEVQQKIQEKLNETFPIRQTSQLLKVRIADSTENTTALLSIWNPTSDVTNLLIENDVIQFYYITSNGFRDRTLQLTSTKYTKYKKVDKKKTNNSLFKRNLTEISMITSKTLPFNPMFGEFDTIGIVFNIKSSNNINGPTYVYLTDLEQNFLCIVFWTSLQIFGFDKMITLKSVIHCKNLHWRSSTSNSINIPTSYAREMTNFVNNSLDLINFKSRLNNLNLENFIEDCSSNLLKIQNEFKNLRYNFSSNPNSESAKPPLKQLTPAQQKIKQLGIYGEVPISPIYIKNATSYSEKDFKTPIRKS